MQRVFGVIFHFYTNFNGTFCNQTVENLITASDLGLHCVPMYHKKDARIIYRLIDCAKGFMYYMDESNADVHNKTSQNKHFTQIEPTKNNLKKASSDI